MHFIFSGAKLTGLNHHTIAVHYNSARRAAGEQLTPPWRWLDNSGLGKNSTDWRLETPNMEPGCQLVFLSHYWYSETMSNTVLAACIKSTVHVRLSFNIGDNGWIHLILIFETTDRWSWIIEWPRRRWRRSGCRFESQGELCQCQYWVVLEWCVPI